MRIAFARAISILAHPVVLVLIAAMVVASSRGATILQLRFVGTAVFTIGIIVLGFSWLQVRTGRWAHVDATSRRERTTLNVFLAGLLFVGAAVLWILTHQVLFPAALALSGALIVTALLVATWVKLSLHTAFAAYATALVWPLALAVLAGALVTVAVMWSRLVLGRHVVADVITGLALGTVAGVAYQLWVV